MDDERERALEAANQHLNKALADQAKAEELEARADREIAEAKAELDEALHEEEQLGDDEARVHFADLIEREKVVFKVRVEQSLQEIWDRAYEKLKVEKRPRDILQAIHAGRPPTSLMDYLGLSLAEAQRRELCEVRFEIATGTGGA